MREGWNNATPPSKGLSDHQGRNHVATTVALCACTLCHRYLLTSPFPYSGYKAMSLITETAGTCAGLVLSRFMIVLTFSSYPWGKAADIYGRRFVLVTSLACSCVLNLAFGLSPTYRWASVARFFLGLSNGMIGTVKTAISELAGGDQKAETRMMGIVMGMWGEYNLLDK